MRKILVVFWFIDESIQSQQQRAYFPTANHKKIERQTVRNIIQKKEFWKPISVKWGEKLEMSGRYRKVWRDGLNLSNSLRENMEQEKVRRDEAQRNFKL